MFKQIDSTEALAKFEVARENLGTAGLMRPRAAHETFPTPADSPQTWSLERFGHAEVEVEVENLQILHPDVEIKENNPKTGFFLESHYSLLS